MMMKRNPAVQLTLAALAALGLDQLSKFWLLYSVGMIDRAPIEITGFFRLVMVWNKGVSFGMLSGADALYFLIAVAVVISLILGRLALKSPLVWERVAYGFIIGGAMGNVIDRVRMGAVADFFYFHLGTQGFPAFNIADSAIFVGVCILLLTMFKNSKMAA